MGVGFVLGQRISCVLYFDDRRYFADIEVAIPPVSPCGIFVAGSTLNILSDEIML